MNFILKDDILIGFLMSNIKNWTFASFFKRITWFAKNISSNNERNFISLHSYLLWNYTMIISSNFAGTLWVGARRNSVIVFIILENTKLTYFCMNFASRLILTHIGFLSKHLNLHLLQFFHLIIKYCSLNIDFTPAI